MIYDNNDRLSELKACFSLELSVAVLVTGRHGWHFVAFDDLCMRLARA